MRQIQCPWFKIRSVQNPKYRLNLPIKLGRGRLTVCLHTKFSADKKEQIQ